jgi:hypothetical protein
MKINMTQLAASRIRELNWADNELYNYFYEKFSLKVEAFGREKMSQEVIELKNRTKFWSDYCSDQSVKSESIINKQIGNMTCWFLTTGELALTDFIRVRQIERFPGSVHMIY